MNTSNNTTAQLGTDVKFKFTFKNKNDQKIPIFAIHGVFINRTLKDKLDECSAKDNLHRYPHEPLFGYNANQYILNQSGIPKYNAVPIQMYKKHHIPTVQYPATIQYDNYDDTVDVMFLADTQREPGVYDLILYVRTIDNEGFRENNIRKFSVSYESILTLTTESTKLPSGIENINLEVY